MKILISCGGTGGHIFPALNLANKIKDLGNQVMFVLNKGGYFEELVKNKGFEIISIPIIKISFNPLDNFFKFIWKLFLSFMQSFLILKRFKPEIVVGFGGYASFPVICNANILKIPIIIHEQNVIAGRANRILSRFAQKVAISFKESQKYFNSKKLVLTGLPCREEFLSISMQEACQRLNLKEDKFTILVMGGSQGSHKINSVSLNTISLLENKDIQVIHLSGKKDFSFLKQEYAKLGVTARVFDFLENIGYAYKLADLIVSRAGASAVMEIAMFAIPAILIPYPFAYEHQMANAKVLANSGAAIVIEDDKLSSGLLKECISKLMQDEKRLLSMRDFSKRIFISDSAARLNQAVLSLA